MAAKKPRKPKKKAAAKKEAKQPFAVLPPSLDIRKVGRPSKYDPSFCDLVLELGAQGKSRAQMAACLGIDRATLNDWCEKHEEFSRATKKALDLSLAWWEDAGQVNMTRQGFNATAYIFQIKNRFRDDYRDVNHHEHAGRDGGPIETRQISDREFARWLALKLHRGAMNGHANANGHAATE
jgi:hypothetical protein